MPFVSKKPPLKLSEEDRSLLRRIAASRTEKHARVVRSRILLGFAEGKTVSAIAREHKTKRPIVNRCVTKALAQGVEAALSDLPRPGRPRRISDDALAWVVGLACSKPTEHGYASELWTYRALAKHVRGKGPEAGYPELARADKGLMHLILGRHEVRPHKVRYYLEARDPDFEEKKAQLLLVYREVQILNGDPGQGPETAKRVTLSVDEKPGIQALGRTAPDMPPRPGKHPTWNRDHEYVRHGTLSLLSAVDLHTGRVEGIVRERHRSREFIELLQLLHERYPADWKIRLIADNHSSHTSKETRRWLATVPNRFEFVFTPKHGSWLNLIEVFFSKMTRSFLRGLRVESKRELQERIERYLDEVNAEPVVFKWKYQIEEPAHC